MVPGRQAAEAITATQALASEAISHGHDAVDPVALAWSTPLTSSNLL